MSARQIAAILGPTLTVVTLSEILNWRIWAQVTAPVVHLNGALLFVAGLVIVRAHNVWRLRWPIFVSLSGWILILGGLFRLFLPEAKQAPGGAPTTAVLLSLALCGLVLTYFGYLGRNDA